MTQNPKLKTQNWESMRDPEAEQPQFELSDWIACAPFEQLCELEIVSAADGEAVLHMPFKVKFAQGGGLLHGGALTTLADTAVAMAIKSQVPEGSRFGTIEMTTRFLAPVRRGMVEARARIVEWRGRDIVAEAEVFDDDGRQVARFTSCFRLSRTAAERLTQSREER
jgi:acyl-CoA thioesterase